MEVLKLGVFAFARSAYLTLEKLVADSSVDIRFIALRTGDDDKDIKGLCKEHNIDCLENIKVNSEVFIEKAVAYNCDLFVSMNFDQILKSEIINLPPLKTINCHTGLLPFYKGRNILNWVLINDEKEYGVTVHYVDEGIDTGDIVLQERYPITDEDSYYTLLEAVFPRYAEVLYRAIKEIQAGTSKRIKQEEIHPTGFYCGGRGSGDEIVDWYQPSRSIFNFVRAVYHPEQLCAASYVKGKEVLIKKARMVPQAPAYIGIPGQVVGKSSGSFTVKTADTVIEVTDYESPEKIRIGTRFSNKEA